MSLILHCGAHPMTRSEIAEIPTPPAAGSRHHPVPYIDFIEGVTDSLRHIGMSITEEAYGATPDGGKFFGLMSLNPINGIVESDFGFQVGLRASHNQTLARGLVAGERTFVCDNLSFSGDIRISTRQTTNIERRLPGMIMEAVQTLPGVFEVIRERNHAYQDYELKQRWGDAALIEMLRRGILLPTQVGRALKEWDTPSHWEHLQTANEAVLTRTAATLKNAVTEALKAPIDPETGLATRAGAPMAMEKTIGLTQFLDEIVGFDVKVN